VTISKKKRVTKKRRVAKKVVIRKKKVVTRKTRGSDSHEVGPTTKRPLKRGERALTEVLKKAIETFGEDNVVVQECVETLVKISRGTIRGRYVGERLRATRELLDRLLGKPEQPLIVRGDRDAPIRSVYVVEDADGSSATPWITTVPTEGEGGQDS
jgi:hypothetical protein